MPRNQVEDQIRGLVDAFVGELSQLIRFAAFQVVQDAIGGSPAAAPLRRKAGARRKKKAGRRGRRSKADLGELSESLLAHIRANPGQRLEEISAELGSTSPVLRPAIQRLLAEGQIRAEGRARGTRYLVGGGRKRAGAGKKRAVGARRAAGGRKKAGKRRKKGARRSKSSAESSAQTEA